MKKLPCSPNETTCGMAWFPRMLDKIRLNERNELPDEYIQSLGIGFDGRCIRYMRIEYRLLVERVIKGGTNEEIFEWCMENGRALSEEDITIWTDFMRKRGLRDSPEIMKDLADSKSASGLSDREDIDTYFKYNDADEGRDPHH